MNELEQFLLDLRATREASVLRQLTDTLGCVPINLRRFVQQES
jgi:hypothetical protein